MFGEPWTEVLGVNRSYLVQGDLPLLSADPVKCVSSKPVLFQETRLLKPISGFGALLILRADHVQRLEAYRITTQASDITTPRRQCELCRLPMSLEMWLNIYSRRPLPVEFRDAF